MRPKIYEVKLTEFEKTYIEEMIKDDSYSARLKKRAKIILLSDEGKYDKDISDKLNVSIICVYKLRRRFCEINLDALFDTLRPGQPAKYKNLYGKIITLVLCDIPKERGRWSISLIKKQLKQDLLNSNVPAEETIRLILKKYNLKPWENNRNYTQSIKLINKKKSPQIIPDAFGKGTTLSIDPGGIIETCKITQPIINAIKDELIRVV